MTFWRRVDRLLRPPGYVPLGSPASQARLARGRRWFGAGAIAAVVVATGLTVAGLAGGPQFLMLSAVLGINYLGGWRITHPPRDDDPTD